MSDYLTIPAIVSRVTSLADGTVRVSLDSNELPEATMGRVMGVAARKEFGTMVWVPDGGQVDDAHLEAPETTIPAPVSVDESVPLWREPSKGKGVLRNSQRIRIAARQRWEKFGGHGDFEGYYTKITDRIIQCLNDDKFTFTSTK